MTLLGLFSLLLGAPLALALTTPPSGAKIVRQTNTQAGEYRSRIVHYSFIYIFLINSGPSTVSAAVASLSGTAAAAIFIYPGTYTEQVTVTYSGMRITWMISLAYFMYPNKVP